MADDNVIRRPVTSSSDVAQRMGELVQRADASKSVVEEAAMSLVSEVDKMAKQIGVFQDYLEEIRELGGNVGVDGNGTGAAMVLENPELTDAVKEQTEAARETRETFASLQDKIEKEQQERTKKVDEFILALDDDRRQMAEEMRQRDNDFYDKMSNVVRQSSASSQQSSFDRLVEAAQGPGIADRVTQGAGTLSDVAQAGTSVIGALGQGGARGMGTIASVLSKAGGALKFLGPVGAVLGTAVAGLNLIEGGIDQFQGLKNSSLEATGSTGNLNVGIEQGIQSKMTEFTTNLSDKDVQTIQQGLMKGGATYGSETYGQGYDWVVGATQERGLSASKATDEYVKSVVKGGKSIDYLNEKFDTLASVAESTGASLSAVQQQQQDFSNTMSSLTGSSTEADAAGVDLTRFFGDASGNSAVAANGFISANGDNPMFQTNVSQNIASGMDTGQAYAAAIQQTAGYASQTKGSEVEALVDAVLNGDSEKFKSIVNGLKTATGLGPNGGTKMLAKQVAVQQSLASLFGMQSLPVDLFGNPDEVFNMLSDVLVGGANRAQQEDIGEDGVNSMLDRAKGLGGSTEASSINTYSEAGIIEMTGMQNYVSGLESDGKKGDSVLKGILSKNYADLSDDEKAIFMQAMQLSGEVTSEDMAGMTEEGMERMFGDTAWSYGEYGKDIFNNQTGAAEFLANKFDWGTKNEDWFGYANSGAGEAPISLTVRWEDDAEKVVAIMAERGKEQMQSDNGGS
jgi:hypothetical protein